MWHFISSQFSGGGSQHTKKRQKTRSLSLWEDNCDEEEDNEEDDNESFKTAEFLAVGEAHKPIF